jgi:hypothetical protein
MEAFDAASATPSRLRQFGLIVGGLTAALFGVLPLLFGSVHRPAWPWAVGAVLALTALVAPASLRPVYKGWMRVGAVLGWVNTRILLLIVYCLLVVPIGLVMRLSGRDPMARRIDKSLASYRIKSRDDEPSRMKAPY